MSVNLMLRTEYSFLNSLCSIDKVVGFAKEAGYTALGMADMNNLYGGFKFYKACQKAGLKPIIGSEISVAFGDALVKVLLYASDTLGYQNLMKIVTLSKLNQNSISYETLMDLTLGIICVASPDQAMFMQGENSYYQRLKEIFNYFYLGISPNLLEQFGVASTIELLNKGYRGVAVADTRYFAKSDHENYLVLQAISSSTLLKNQLDQNDHHFLSSVEWQTIYHELPDLLTVQEEIASLCNVEIKTGERQLPRFDESIDAYQYLSALCYKGLGKRLGSLNDVYVRRLKKELDIINQMGFCDYFLIVWDFVKYAKKNGILVGPGRGSAAGSLVSYTLGITEIDPIRYQLLFERFLNPERITMPDIDVDFPDIERDKVIRYVSSRYGKDKVAHIATFGTFASRSALRDVIKAVGLSEVRSAELLKHFPDSKKSLQEVIDSDEDLQKLMGDYQDIKKCVDYAKAIEGLPRNVSTHAAGIIITQYDMVNYTPLDKGLNDIYQTQYEAKDLEELGLLKMDFLGLRNLTIIKKCSDMIQKDYPNFALPKEYNDAKTLKLIASGDTVGVFQLESAGMRQTLRNIQVNSFEDICAAIALYRPGPMEMIPTFIARKTGRERVTYLHPDLEPILKSTYGVIVYQEQIILIACKFAGYSLGEADVLRRAVSKKNQAILVNEQAKFIKGCLDNGYSKEVATQIYDYILKFANYGFNRSHSVVYAVVAYIIAYLKCHYPNYYYCTLLNSVIGTDNLIEDYLTEVSGRHLRVLSPNINESTNEFRVFDGYIMLPLTQIHGIGQAYYDVITSVRTETFASFEDCMTKLGDTIPASTIENLIYAGAFDSFGITKKSMIDNYQALISRSKYTFVKNVKQINYDTEEFTYGYLLNKEKEVLGVNVKYSFMYQYASYYRHNQAVYINNVHAGNCSVLGSLIRKKTITDKNNKNMLFATIKDETGTISLTVFADLFDSFKNLPIGSVVLVAGVAEVRKNEMQIRVNDFKVL